MATIKTEATNASVADDVKILIISAGKSSLPVVLLDGSRVTIENSSGQAFVVVPEKDRQEEANDTIEVHVYDPSQIMKSPVYKVKPSDKVLMLKYQIVEREGIKPNRIHLSKHGSSKDLDDLRTFADHNIQNKDTIQLRFW